MRNRECRLRKEVKGFCSHQKNDWCFMLLCCVQGMFKAKELLNLLLNQRGMVNSTAVS